MAFKADTESENKAITSRYKKLLRTAYQTLSLSDKRLIRKALNTAIDAHENQRRKSGEPYVYHPLAVAQITAEEIGLSATGIAAALLHDTVEDNAAYTLDRIGRLFDEKIVRIIDGLTKISRFDKNPEEVSIQAENFRKLLLTLSDDVRVILIKIADRLHNMRTLDHMPRHKQQKIASETLFIYAPLAHRLGLYNIKTELEDLGLKYTEPNIYYSILTQIKESRESQAQYIDAFAAEIKDKLERENIDFTIKGRSKSICSIRRKMLRQGIPLDEVFDRFAIRIIYKSDLRSEKFTAWKIYAVVTDVFTPNPTRLRDWISAPKSTGYEALHITVLGHQSRWVEVQIRSERMDEIAEKGYAAHYKYKHGNHDESGLEKWLNNIKEVLENPEINAVDFIEDFKLNLYAEEIFVFTPVGDIKKLPKGATALDFAYEIHTAVGDHCLGARVNSTLVPLSCKLKSGDTIAIINSQAQYPKADWLDFVITSKARTKIKAALKTAHKKVAGEGREILSRKLKHLRVDLNEKTINQLVAFFKEKTSRDVFYKVGTGEINSKAIKEFVNQRGTFFNLLKKITRQAPANTIKKAVPSNQKGGLVFGPDRQALDYTLGQCCKPIPGDKIFGFLTVDKGIKVHREDCPNAVSLQGNYAYRIIKAKWVDSQYSTCQATLKLEGLDSVGIVNKIAEIVTNQMQMNIQSLNIHSEDGYFTGVLNLMVQNKTQLQKLIMQLRKIDGIKKLRRL
ncbi:MAG: RelA/SpoT family protein [Flavobacteriales bacterium]